MDRLSLARRAYNTAMDRTSADASLSPVEKRAKYIRLSNAYEARKEAIRFSEYVSFHRLDRVLGNLARESAEGRVGNTAIHLNRETEHVAG